MALTRRQFALGALASTTLTATGLAANPRAALDRADATFRVTR